MPWLPQQCSVLWTWLTLPVLVIVDDSAVPVWNVTLHHLMASVDHRLLALRQYSHPHANFVGVKVGY